MRPGTARMPPLAGSAGCGHPGAAGVALGAAAGRAAAVPGLGHRRRRRTRGAWLAAAVLLAPAAIAADLPRCLPRVTEQAPREAILALRPSDEELLARLVYAEIYYPRSTQARGPLAPWEGSSGLSFIGEPGSADLPPAGRVRFYRLERPPADLDGARRGTSPAAGGRAAPTPP